MAFHLDRNSTDNLSRTSPLATAITIGLVLLQLGDVSPSEIICSINSSSTGFGKKSLVECLEAANELKLSELKLFSIGLPQSMPSDVTNKSLY